MPTNNSQNQQQGNQKPTLESLYKHQPSSVNIDEENRMSKVTNVMDEILINKKSLQDIYLTSDDNEKFVYDDPNYIVKKYSKEYNPSVPNAPSTKQLIDLYKQAKITGLKTTQMRSQGVDFEDMQMREARKDHYNKYGLRRFQNYGGNLNNTQIAYKGFNDPSMGIQTDIGTNEEIAMSNPKMIMDGVEIDNPGKDMINQIYGGKKVITTIKDPSTGRDMFNILPLDSFVPAEQQYSPMWGPKETHGNAFMDFAKGVYSSATAGTMKSFSSIGSLINDTFNYDENYIHKDPRKAMEHIDKVIQASLELGNLEQAERLQNARETYNPQTINEALNNAYSSMPSNIGQELRREAQPVNFGKMDKSMQAYFNEYNQMDFKNSLSTEEGDGTLKWMARQNHTLGYLLPQIAIGMASGGGSLLAQGMAAGAGKVALQNVVKYVTPVLVNSLGASQAFSSFERTAQESGVSPENIAKWGWYALPLTYVTEHFTNKWIGDQIAPNLFGKAMREVYEPIAKKMAAQQAAGTLTDKGIKDAVVGSFKKIYSSKFIQGVKSSDGYISNIIRANVSEAVQENTEQELYNTIQRFINDAAPSYAIEGNGKFANSEFGATMAETTLGTIFATTLMTAVTGIVPKVIRKRTGQPEPTSRQKAQEMLKWDVLKNGGENVIKQADEENAKTVNIFGNKNIKAKDSFIDGTYTPDMMVAPESPSVQARGYKVGQEIDNFAEMHYLELLEQVDSYSKLNSDMGLNDLDRSILSSAGFDDEISLNKSADAFVAMQEAKKVYESIQDETIDTSLSQEDQQKIKDKNELNKKPALEQYNKALKDFQYYSSPETYTTIENGTEVKKSTNHSKAVNDMVKRNITYMKQVEMAMTQLNGNKQITKEQKNDPNFVGLYNQAWDKVIKEQYTYERLMDLKESVDMFAELEKQKQSSVITDINERTTSKSFNAELDTLSKKVKDLNEKSTTAGFKYDAEEHNAIVRDIAGLSNRLAKELTMFDRDNTTMNNDELDALATKYKSLYSEATGVTTRINENEVANTNKNTLEQIKVLQKDLDTLLPQIATLQEQLVQQQEIMDNATEETLVEESAKYDEIKSQLESLKQQYAGIENTLESRTNGLADTDAELNANAEEDADGNKKVINTNARIINKAAELNQSIPGYHSRINESDNLPYLQRSDIAEAIRENESPEEYANRLQTHNNPIPHKKETQDEFNERIAQLQRENTPTGKTFLSGYFGKMKDDMLEAQVWINSVLKDQGETYKKLYPEKGSIDKPKGQYYGEEGPALIKKNIERINSTIDTFSKTFKTAAAIQGEQRMGDHQSADEKQYIQEMGIKDTDGINPYEKILLEAKSLSSDVLERLDGAALANKKVRLHTRVIIHENTRKSVDLITALGLTKADGTKILSTGLEKQIIELGDISQDVLDAHGNLDENQIILLAQRESIVNNVLSALTVEYNKDSAAFLSVGNRNKLFEIFDAFYEHNGALDENKNLIKSEGTIMHLDDAKSHLGTKGPKTNMTRENHSKTPLYAIENNKIVYKFGENKSDATRLREHLNVIMWIGSKYTMNDIFQERKIIFEKEQDLGLETGEQEAVVNTIIAHLSNHEVTSPLQAFKERFLELHNRPHSKNANGENVYGQKIENWLSNALTIGGDYGTGKTQFMTPRAFKILQALDTKTGRKESSIGLLRVVSITPKLQQVHVTAFGKYTAPKTAEYNPFLSYDEFFKNLSSMPVEAGNTYIIDEASIISSSKNGNIDSELMRLEKHFNDKGAKILLLGDVFQMRDATSNSKYPLSMYQTMTTHMITEQFSATSPLLRSMAEAARSAINGGIGFVQIDFPPVTERIDKNGAKNGARYFDSKLEVWNSFVDEKDNSGNRAIVFLDKAELNKFKEGNPTLEKQYEANKDKVFFAVRRNGELSHDLLQGLRQEEVYLMYSQYEWNTVENPISSSLMASALYTGIGRAGGTNMWVGMVEDTKKNVTPNLADSINLPQKEMNAIQQLQSQQFREIEKLRFDNLKTDNNVSPIVFKPAEKPSGKGTNTIPTSKGDMPSEGWINIDIDGIKTKVDWSINTTHSGKTVYLLKWDGNITKMEISKAEEVMPDQQKRDFFKYKIDSAITEFNDKKKVKPVVPVVEPKPKAKRSSSKKNKENPTIVNTNPLQSKEHNGVKLEINNSFVSDGQTYQILGILQHEWTNGDITYSYKYIDAYDEIFESDLIGKEVKSIQSEIEDVPSVVANTSRNAFLTNSTKMFIAKSDETKSVFWGTSATLVGIHDIENELGTMSSTDEKYRRGLNDAVMAQYKTLQDAGFSLNVKREKNTGKDRESNKAESFDMLVVYLNTDEVSDAMISGLKSVLESSSVWLNVEKTFSNPLLSNKGIVDAIFTTTGMNGNKPNMAIGSISLPTIPSLGTDDKLVYKSFEVGTKEENYSSLKTTLNNAWKTIYDNEILFKDNPELKQAIQQQWDMNLSLFDTHASFKSGDTVLLDEENYFEGVRKVLYVDGTVDKTVITLQDFLKDYPNAQLAYTPLYVKDSNGTKLRLKVYLGTEELDLVVRMPRFSDDKYEFGEKVQIRANEAAESLYSLLIVDNNNGLAKGKVLSWKELQANFKETTAYKLILGNLSIIQKLPKDNPLVKNITINEKGFVEIKSSLPADQKAGDIQNKYNEIMRYLLDKNNLIKDGLYDYLSIENDSYGTHIKDELGNNRDIIEVLNIAATGMNNKSFYLGLPKVDSIPLEVPVTKTAVKSGGKYTKKPEIYNNTPLYEETKYSSPEVIDIKEATERVSKRLGTSFIASEYFTIKDGKIFSNNGKIANGQVIANAFMTLSQENGLITASTPEHEVFHIVYRNFVKPEQQRKLKDAVRIINDSEKGLPINSDLDAEEWMARDYAKQNRVSDTGNSVLDFAINAWNRFKDFIKAVVTDTMPIYYANKTIKNLYSKINAGEFVDRVSEIKPDDSNAVYEEEDTFEEQSNLSVNERSEHRLEIATKMESELISQLKNKANIVRAKNKIRMTVIQSSPYSNMKVNKLQSFNDSINEIIEDSKYMQEMAGDTIVRILVPDVDGKVDPKGIAITVKEYVERNDSPNLVDGTDMTDIDNYRIYTNSNVRMLVQIMMPSYDMMKDSFEHETGAGERFDWDGYSAEQNFNTIQKMYLSSVPRINADGISVIGKPLFLDYKEVHSMMIDLGIQVSKNNLGDEYKVGQMQDIMLAMIQQGKIHKVQHVTETSTITSNEYVNETVEKYHSIYNYMFGEVGNKKIKNYQLNYDNTMFSDDFYDGKYKGLLERSVENELDWKKEVGVNQTSSDWIVDSDQALEARLINNARMHIHSIVASYTSMNIKSQVIAEYYEDTMKFTHYSKELWNDTALKLKDIQKYDVKDGFLKKSKLVTLQSNVGFNNTNNNIDVLVYKNDKFKTPFLKYDGDKFRFVSTNGTMHQSMKVGSNLSSAFKDGSLDNNGEYKNALKQFNKIKNLFGLKGITTQMFKSILMADTWDQVTDSIKKINKLDHTSNFNSEMKNYTTPADFIADYLGTMLTMYKQYSSDYVYDNVTMIDGIKQSSIETLNLLNYIQYHTDEKLSHIERIKSVPGLGTNVLMNYLKNTTPKNLIKFEIKGEIVDGVEMPIEKNKIRYILPEDMWVSTNMIAAMMQKIQNKTNDSSRRTAEGKQTYSVQLRTALYDELNDYKPKDGDNIIITEFVESTGEKRSLGFTSIGKTKIDTADFIDTSINMFMQEMVKEQSKPTIYVPMTTISDTGKIIYAKVDSNLISTNNGFKINYTVAASEILREYDKNVEKTIEARKLLNNSLNELNTITGLEFPLIPENYTEQWFSTELGIKMKEQSLLAHQNGTYEIVKKFIDNTTLTKNDNLKNKRGKNYFDITYNSENGLEYIQPGYNITGYLNNYNFDFNKPFPGRKSRYIDRIRELHNEVSKGDITNEDKLENAIKKVFEDDYKKFTEMVISHGFDPVRSMDNLTENTLNGKLKNPKDLEKGDNPYYQYIHKTKDTNSEIRFNQPLFGYYLSTIFTNNHIDDFSLNPFSFKDYFDKVKRDGPLNTPATALLINEKKVIKQNGKTYLLHDGTLPAISNGIFYRDNEVNGGKTWQVGEDGKPVYTNANNEIKPEDGQMIIMPFHYKMQLNSIGGTDTVIGKAAMFKGLINFKRTDGSYSQIKRGDKVITGFDMQHTYYKNMFMRMLAETDFNLIDRVGQEVFESKNLSFTNKFIELYDDKDNQRDFEQIIDTMMDWIYNQQFYSNDKIVVNEEGITIAGHMYSSIVAFMAPTSTQKGSITKVNDYHALYDTISSDVIGEYNTNNRMNMDYIDNSKIKIVMNPSQDTDVDNKLQSAPTQQDATGLAITNNAEVSGLYNDYMLNKQNLQEALRKNLEEAISNMDGLPKGAKSFKEIDWSSYPASGLSKAQQDEINPAIKQFQKFMRKRVVNSLRTSGQDLAFIELFNAENVSLNLPMMRSKVILAYRNLTNQAIQGRIKGIRLTQSVGEYIEEYVKDGRTYSKNDVLNQEHQGGSTSLLFEQYYSQQLEDTITGLGYQKRFLKDMEINETTGETEVGHVVMSNIYANIYGHRSNESMIDIQQIRIGNKKLFINDAKSTDDLVNVVLNNITNEKEDWKTIIDSPMVRKAIQNLKIEKYIDNILTSEQDDKGHIKISRKLAELLQTSTTLKTEAELLQLSQMNESVLDSIDAMDLESTDIKDADKVIIALMSSDEIVRMVMEETRQLLQSFEQANTAFLSRVPATFLGSGGVFKTVMFHNGGNVVYIPTGMTNRNDSDYDIDALTLYANSIDRRGHTIIDGADGFRNKMNDNRIAITLHKSMQEAVFITSSVKNIDKVVEDNYKKQERFYNNSPRSIYESYKRNKAGADAIGILANTLTVASSLISASKNGIVETGKNSGIGAFIKSNTIGGIINIGVDGFVTELGTWQQTALDNAKNNSFANYGISPLAINILGVLKLNKKTNQEIYDFFNNYEVQQLFDDYSGKTSIMTKSSDYSIVKLAQDRELEIKKNLDFFLNSEKSNVRLFLASIGQEWNTNINDTDKYIQDLKDIDVIIQNNIDSNLLAILRSYQAGQSFYDKYNFNGTAEDVQLNIDKWKEDNKLDDRTLYNFADTKILFSEDNKLLNAKELSGLTKEQEASLMVMIKARANINLSKSKLDGMKYMSMLPKLSVTADAMYRLSTIFGLRKGIPSLDREFDNTVRNIEEYMGMSLKDYVTNDKHDLNVERQVNYFMLHNDNYNKMKESTADKKTDKEFLVKQETLIANEINIANYIKNNPQLDYIMNELYRQQQMTQQMFIHDNALIKDQVIDGFLEEQNRTSLIYGGEVSVANNVINDVLIDNYFNSIGDKSITKGLYIQKTTLNSYQNNSRALDLKSLFDRQSFVNNFPEFIMNINDNISNVNYLKQAFINPPSEIDLMKLENNGLLKLLSLDGRENGKLRLDVNIKEMTENRVAFLHDEFKKLPVELQSMLTNYEIIANRMNYTKGGLMQVIGVDFFKGKISETYERIHKGLISNEGMDALVPDSMKKEGVTFNNLLKERIYDNLGLKPEFSVYWNGDEPNYSSPTYVYDYEVKQNDVGEVFKTGRKINYKLDENYKYVAYNNITSLGLSSDKAFDLTTELKVFTPSVEEEHLIDMSLKNPGKRIDITHIANYAWVEHGQFIYTRTGILVKVIKIDGTNFNYRVANESDINKREEDRRKDIEKKNNRIELAKNTLQYDILSPNATSINEKPLVYKVKGDKFFTGLKINTVTNEDKPITIPMFDNKQSFTSIQDVLDTFKSRLIQSVGEKAKKLKTELNQFTGNNEEEQRISRTKHVNTYMYNLLETANMVDENGEPTVEAKQARIVRAYIIGRESLLLKHLVVLRINEYLKNGKIEDVTSTNFIRNQETVFNASVENVPVGKSKYGMVVRTAIINRFNPDANLQMRNKEQERSDMLNTLEGSLSLWNQETKSNDTTNNKTINVYWGQEETENSTRILSNLAPRTFNYKGHTFYSVEHAYQTLKSGKFDAVIDKQYKDKGGYGVKISGKSIDKNTNLQLMKDLVVQSFTQNIGSESTNKLMEYNNFTHNTNEIIDKAFLAGLKLAQNEVSKITGLIIGEMKETKPLNIIEHNQSGYPARTNINAQADATIAIAIDFNSAGEKLTKKLVEQNGKKFISVDMNEKVSIDAIVERIVNQLNEVNAKTLNIAGNGIYSFGNSQTDIDNYVYDILSKVVSNPNLKNNIESIRSGGQTGIDESGAKAAIKLGIPTTILAPKGFMFRGKDKVDISNEAKFKERFITNDVVGEKITEPITDDNVTKNNCKA